MCIVCLAVDSHEMPSLIFLENKKNIYIYIYCCYGGRFKGQHVSRSMSGQWRLSLCTSDQKLLRRFLCCSSSVRTSMVLISASNGSSSPNRGAVRRADALLQTIYVTSDVCDRKCDGPTNAWWFGAYPEKL